MSRRKSEEEYAKTKAGKFFRWLSGEEDPFLGKIEMKEESSQESKVTLEEIDEDHKLLLEKVYDMERNREIKYFQYFYRFMSVVFCIILISVLIYTVSFLPKTGNANNPDNNVVSRRYIEKGLQETGAVNIVTGMILDYRAFDTFGESNV
ncbi:hypothetical protein D7X25_23710, partial [bacterium 1XD42-8]